MHFTIKQIGYKSLMITRHEEYNIIDLPEGTTLPPTLTSSIVINQNEINEFIKILKEYANS